MTSSFEPTANSLSAVAAPSWPSSRREGGAAPRPADLMRWERAVNAPPAVAAEGPKPLELPALPGAQEPGGHVEAPRLGGTGLMIPLQAGGDSRAVFHEVGAGRLLGQGPLERSTPKAPMTSPGESAEGVQTWTVDALRQSRCGRHQFPAGAGPLGEGEGGVPSAPSWGASEPTPAGGPPGSWLPSTAPSEDHSPVDDGPHGAGRGGQLQALIESSCSRLWVDDAGGRGVQGVMLDLGHWLPGCTVELAKAAGVLRVTLRGVDDAQRVGAEAELLGLGEDLALKLGCRVVTAVAGEGGSA